jgi:hypothetical protein
MHINANIRALAASYVMDCREPSPERTQKLAHEIQTLIDEQMSEWEDEDMEAEGKRQFAVYQVEKPLVDFERQRQEQVGRTYEAADMARKEAREG